MAASLRLLALLAMLLMPFGMAAAPASPGPQHHVSGFLTEHCPDSPAEDLAGGPADCAMPCAAALPAFEAASAGIEAEAPTLRLPAVHTTLDGILLEIATPPPKGA